MELTTTAAVAAETKLDTKLDAKTNADNPTYFSILMAFGNLLDHTLTPNITQHPHCDSIEAYSKLGLRRLFTNRIITASGYYMKQTTFSKTRQLSFERFQRRMFKWATAAGALIEDWRPAHEAKTEEARDVFIVSMINAEVAHCVYTTPQDQFLSQVKVIRKTRRELLEQSWYKATSAWSACVYYDTIELTALNDGEHAKTTAVSTTSFIRAHNLPSEPFCNKGFDWSSMPYYVYILNRAAALNDHRSRDADRISFDQYRLIKNCIYKLMCPPIPSKDKPTVILENLVSELKKHPDHCRKLVDTTIHNAGFEHFARKSKMNTGAIAAAFVAVLFCVALFVLTCLVTPNAEIRTSESWVWPHVDKLPIPDRMTLRLGSEMYDLREVRTHDNQKALILAHSSYNSKFIASTNGMKYIFPDHNEKWTVYDRAHADALEKQLKEAQAVKREVETLKEHIMTMDHLLIQYESAKVNRTKQINVCEFELDVQRSSAKQCQQQKPCPETCEKLVNRVHLIGIACLFCLLSFCCGLVCVHWCEDRALKFWKWIENK